MNETSFLTKYTAWSVRLFRRIRFRVFALAAYGNRIASRKCFRKRFVEWIALGRRYSISILRGGHLRTLGVLRCLRKDATVGLKRLFNACC